jgi:hypothetical protein
LIWKKRDIKKFFSISPHLQGIEVSGVSAGTSRAGFSPAYYWYFFMGNKFSRLLIPHGPQTGDPFLDGRMGAE